MLALLLAACVRPLPVTVASSPAPTDVDLDAPGPIVVETAISGTWAVPLSGLLDLDDPRAAGFEDAPHDIVLPVHVLRHPEHGVFIVDTGLAEESPARGLIAQFLKDVERLETLAAILARQPAPLAGVLLTHVHLDHVLGLPDVPEGVPIYAGPGEERAHRFNDRLTLPTVRRGLNGRPLTQWDFASSDPLGPVDAAVDVLGDGSLWALHVPGHTPGSTAYLARTVDGPVLFTGDCSHTRWGFEHGVPPGTYTLDREQNAQSLAALRALAEAHPTMRVEVGHER